MALTTIARVESVRPPIKGGVFSDDPVLYVQADDALNAASAWFETAVGRELADGAHLYQLGGNGTPILKLRHWPISYVSSLLVQGVEWVQLIRHGLRASSSPYGGTFYTLIGCHAVHVLAAVITLVVLLAWIGRTRRIERWQTPIAVCRLYWLFVVAVWPLLYVLVYLA